MIFKVMPNTPSLVGEGFSGLLKSLIFLFFRCVVVRASVRVDGNGMAYGS